MLERIKSKLNTASIEKEQSSSKLVKMYYSLVGFFAVAALATSPAAAGNSGLKAIFDKVSASLKDIYGQVVGISTVVAVTFIAICLLVRMFSKNQRAVEEATAWIKRIAITWFILNTLAFFVKYFQELAYDKGSGPQEIPWN